MPQHWWTASVGIRVRMPESRRRSVKRGVLNQGVANPAAASSLHLIQVDILQDNSWHIANWTCRRDYCFCVNFRPLTFDNSPVLNMDIDMDFGKSYRSKFSFASRTLNRSLSIFEFVCTLSVHKQLFGCHLYIII